MEPGLNRDFIISAQDGPTLAELAGATEHLPSCDWDLVRTGLVWRNTLETARVPTIWEWVQWNWGKNEAVDGGLMQGLRKGNWKIARGLHSEQPWELYNLADDIGETKNLAKQEPERLKVLVALAEQAQVPMRPQEEPKHPAESNSTESLGFRFSLNLFLLLIVILLLILISIPERPRPR